MLIIKMRKLIKYFLKVRRELLLLLIIAIVTHLLIEIVFNQYEEIFVGAYYFGQFFSKLSIAYISAFIFYFFVVHIKNERDKENINEYIGHKVFDILTSAHLLIQPFQNKTDKKARFQYFDFEELKKLLHSINRNDNEAPLKVGGINGRNANWIEWYEYLKESTLKSIEEIFIRYNHLDSELIKLLTRIQNSMFFKQFDMLYNFEYINTFKIYEYQIYNYLNHIKNLEDYAKKHFQGHEFITKDFVEGS